jgi:uncharacterized protein YndB with AHSA1/START domain
MKRENFEPTPLVAAEALAADGGRWTLVFVREFNHAPEKLWDALTDPAQLNEWAPFTASRDLGREGDATLTMVDADTNVDLPAEVRRAERPSLLEYTWGSPDDDVPDVLRWELTPTDAGTRLTLRHIVSDKDLIGKVAAGWHLCFDVAELFLDGTPIGAIRGEDAMNYGWQELHDAYAEKLGM